MEKIKSFFENERGKHVLTAIIIILVGLGSFELGRLSRAGTSGGIKIDYTSPIVKSQVLQSAKVVSAINTKPAVVVTTRNFFASSRGNKYYPVGCSAGNNIKQENRLYFATGEEAQKAGYELSSSCK